MITNDNSFHYNSGLLFFPTSGPPSADFLFLTIIYRESHCSLLPLRPEELTGAKSTSAHFVWIATCFQCKMHKRRWKIESGELVSTRCIHHHKLVSCDTGPQDTAIKFGRHLSWSSASVHLNENGYCWRFRRHNYLFCRFSHTLMNIDTSEPTEPNPSVPEIAQSFLYLPLSLTESVCGHLILCDEQIEL